MTPADARARLAERGWTLERVGAAEYGCAQGGWRARRGRFLRGGYRLEHVLQMVDEHEAWERQRPVQLSFFDLAA